MKKLLLLLALICSPALAIDINTATSEELQSIKGIGPGKAKAIVEHRQVNGPFKSIDDLANVKGFGANSIEKFKGDLSVGMTEKKAEKQLGMKEIQSEKSAAKAATRASAKDSSANASKK
ncbi:MAG: ComEA family DNA-binding protein [Burkholderiales bacterium]